VKENEHQHRDVQNPSPAQESAVKAEVQLTPQLRETLECFHDVLMHDQPITRGKVDTLGKQLAGLTVNIAGETFALDDPRLTKNIRLWLKIMKGGYVDDKDLTCVPPGIATMLAKRGTGTSPYMTIELENARSISAESIRRLTQWKGKYIALGITSIDMETAKHLASWGGDRLFLNGLTSLDANTARELAKLGGRGYLGLDGLTALNAETAGELARWKGEVLNLDGLTSMDTETAEQLAQWRGDDLTLRHLISLSAEAAEKLVQWKGKKLNLGLTLLDAQTAEKLAQWQGGELALVFLTSLDAASAQKLAQFKGQLIVNEKFEKIIAPFRTAHHEQ
jgi:hypothetical protein